MSEFYCMNGTTFFRWKLSSAWSLGVPEVLSRRVHVVLCVNSLVTTAAWNVSLWLPYCSWNVTINNQDLSLAEASMVQGHMSCCLLKSATLYLDKSSKLKLLICFSWSEICYVTRKGKRSSNTKMTLLLWNNKNNADFITFNLFQLIWNLLYQQEKQEGF